MNIGSKIKQRRIELQWTQRDLSSKMGYSNHSTIARIESGSVDIPQSRIVKFAEVLCVSVPYLMGWEEEMPKDATNKDDLTMGDVIRSLRTDRQLSLVEFSEEIGISADELIKYENGTKQLSAQTIELIAKAFGMQAVDLTEMLLYSVTSKEFVDQVHRWHKEFGYVSFTREEQEQIFQYAKFLISQRKN